MGRRSHHRPARRQSQGPQGIRRDHYRWWSASSWARQRSHRGSQAVRQHFRRPTRRAAAISGSGLRSARSPTTGQGGCSTSPRSGPIACGHLRAPWPPAIGVTRTVWNALQAVGGGPAGAGCPMVSDRPASGPRRRRRKRGPGGWQLGAASDWSSPGPGNGAGSPKSPSTAAPAVVPGASRYRAGQERGPASRPPQCQFRCGIERPGD